MNKKADNENPEELGELLAAAGMSKGVIESVLEKDRQGMTAELISRYHPKLTGKPLASLLKSIKLYGEPGRVADFLCDVINGPPVAGQILALRIAEKPEWRSFEKIDMALKLYQADFDSLTQAFSHYQDQYLCGCEKRSCMPRI